MIEKILISSCLIGENVRFDGRNKFINHPIIAQWQQQGRLIAVCPEIAGGLCVPRAPCEINGGNGLGVLEHRARVLSNQGIDHTDNFIAGANHALKLAQQHSIKIAPLVAITKFMMARLVAKRFQELVLPAHSCNKREFVSLMKPN